VGSPFIPMAGIVAADIGRSVRESDARLAAERIEFGDSGYREIATSKLEVDRLALAAVRGRPEESMAHPNLADRPLQYCNLARLAHGIVGTVLQ
jgi:hypothetical protein